MLLLEAAPKALGRELARGVPGQPECFGDGLAEQRISEGVENERERALGDMMIFVADGQLRDEAANRAEDRIERIAVSGQDHPCGQGPSALTIEDVEGPIDEIARIRLAGACALDRFRDAGGHRIDDRSRQFSLQASGGAEMVQQVRVRAPDLCRHGLESHRLWPVRKQQSARGFDRGGATLFGAQSFSAC